jgi:hypothetical protein
MNKKLILSLLSSPAVFMSMLSMVMLAKPAQASQVVSSSGTHLSCVFAPHSATPRQVCIMVSNNPPSSATTQVTGTHLRPNQITELNFTDQESDEAIRLFGCDCPRCINAVRQLHGLAQLPV